VRHCKAEGQSPSASLTQEGHFQAKQLADLLCDKNIESIYTSPYVRAIDSIAPLAEKLKIGVNIDNRLKERILSEVDHPNWREMLRNTFNDFDLYYEGGESSLAAMDRILSVIKDVRERGLSNIALVTHGNLMSLLLKHFDDSFGFEEWESLSNPDVYHLQLTAVPVIKRIWDSALS
jgi:2,3-bisphosphoglycerate-dependent phosphoglycerate mutase